MGLASAARARSEGTPKTDRPVALGELVRKVDAKPGRYVNVAVGGEQQTPQRKAEATSDLHKLGRTGRFDSKPRIGFTFPAPVSASLLNGRRAGNIAPSWNQGCGPLGRPQTPGLFCKTCLDSPTPDIIRHNPA